MNGEKKGKRKGRQKKEDDKEAPSDKAEELSKEITQTTNDPENSDEELKNPSKIAKEEKEDDIAAAGSKAPKEKKREGKKKKRTGGKKGECTAEDKCKVLEYLKEQNRPYSALNVFDNLHGEIKKGEMQKVLDALVEEEEVKAKDFGKFVIYLANQDKMPTVPREELERMDKEIDECRERLKNVSEECKEKQKG